LKKKECFNESMANMFERIVGKNCQAAKQYRAYNRRIEKRRRSTHRSMKK
jgi:threonyl-tRNA synthetase